MSPVERILLLEAKEDKKSTRIATLLIVVFLVLVTVACLLYLLAVQNPAKGCIADIYQNGKLILSIPLDRVKEPYSLDIEGDNDCVNHIEIRPGGIGVTWADCPDKLCVNQGFIHSPAIPIACLPNRLVIILRTVKDSDSDTPDIITY